MRDNTGSSSVLAPDLQDADDEDDEEDDADDEEDEEEELEELEKVEFDGTKSDDALVGSKAEVKS